MEDAELLKAWRDGDRDAGGQLIDQHFESIHRFFRSKVRADDVDDLVQTTFEACVKGRDSFREDASIRTYLYAIARRRLYSHFSSSGSKQIDFGVTSLVDMGPTPRTMLSQHRKQSALIDALEAIPLDMQIAIELHYLDGISGPDLAEALGVAEGTVRSRLRRGLEALRVQIAKMAGNRASSDEEVDIERLGESLREQLRDQLR